MKKNSDTLVLIMAAGYGRRMGPLSVPKVMLKTDQGRHYIDDAISFIEKHQADFDFAVMSRDEVFFEPLNDYLKKRLYKLNVPVPFQKTGSRGHVMAFAFEYHLNRAFRRFVRKYNSIVVMPADHALTEQDLDLNHLVACHHQQGADATHVYSRGWGDDTAKKEVIRLLPDGQITSSKQIAETTYQPAEREHAVTSVGVWAFNRRRVVNPLRAIPALLSFALSKTVVKTMSFYSYFIADGWSGGRDTLSSRV